MLLLNYFYLLNHMGSVTVIELAQEQFSLPQG